MNITFKSVAKRFFLAAILMTLACVFVTGFDYYNDNLKDKKSEKTSDNKETETGDSDIDKPDSNYDDMSSFSICLDAACGGSDYGDTDSSGSRYEKDDNLNLTNKVSSILKDEMKFNVYTTRTDDSDVSDSERVTTANDNNCDAIISICRAAYTDANHAQGFESFIYTGEPSNSKALSDSIITKLNATDTMLSGSTGVGTPASSSQDFYINSASNMASVVVVVGYITNDDDNAAFDNNTDKIARAIAEGIYEYIKNKE